MDVTFRMFRMISNGLADHMTHTLTGGGGQGGGRPGEQGAGGVREAGGEGAGSRIPKEAGDREKLRKNFATLQNIL